MLSDIAMHSVHHETDTEEGISNERTEETGRQHDEDPIEVNTNTSCFHSQ